MKGRTEMHATKYIGKTFFDAGTNDGAAKFEQCEFTVKDVHVDRWAASANPGFTHGRYRPTVYNTDYIPWGTRCISRGYVHPRDIVTHGI